MKRRFWSGLVLSAFVAAACETSGGGGPTGNGGSPGPSGGATASGAGGNGAGGTPGAGGSETSGAGGSSDTGGTPGSAGTPATGGVAATGGSTGSAGTPATGGAADAGASNDGGATPAAGSEACGKGLPAPMEGMHTIKANNKDRRFFLRIPDSYDGNKPWPVIMAFHGAGNKDASWFDKSTGLRPQNEAHAVLIFPESLLRPGATTRSWQDEDQLPDNLALVDAALAWLKSNVCVDPQRFFAAGQSSGAYFAQTVGCQRGDVFRAVASSDGGERYFQDCKGNPSAFIRYRPTGLNAADSRRARDFIIKRNQCATSPLQDTNTPPCKAYPGCQNGVQLWECQDNGAHDWPAYMDKGVWNLFSRIGGG